MYLHGLEHEGSLVLSPSEAYLVLFCVVVTTWFFYSSFLTMLFSGGCMELERADVYVEEIRYTSRFRVLADIQCQFVKIS